VEETIEGLSPLQRAEDVLFAGLIDYAGLFPPASLSMADAVDEYRAARQGPHAWMLGRFICPATRLEELAGLLVLTMQPGEEPWPISTILDGDLAVAAVSSWSFDAEMGPAAQIALIEVPPPTQAGDGRSVENAIGTLEGAATAAFTASHVATPFFEIRLVDGWETGVGNLADALLHYQKIQRRIVGAKLRCGGRTAAAFPTSVQVVSFITACVARGLPFKATAGLHHPIRHYDPDLDVMRHGFLNLLTAAALAIEGCPEAELIDVVEETATDAFTIGVAGLSWRDRSVRVGDLVRTRREFASYGSCSFAEPTDDLVELGLIDAPEVG